MNIFYTEADDTVKNALTNRKHYYGGTFRDNDAHAWLNRKMAYVEAFASNTAAARKASLTIRNQGGVGGANSLYSNTTSGHGLYQPKPHIVSVKVSNEGDFGSLKKCEVVFAVYNLKDLDSVQAFFDIGGDISLSYGWTNASAGAGPKGKFAGKIYNFSYNVNAQGGFDCISYGIGEGINILASSAKSSIQSQTGTSTAIDAAQILDVNLIGVIRQMVNDHKPAADVIDELITNTDGTVKSGTGMGAVAFSTGWDKAIHQPVEYYISLEGLVNVINTRILTKANISSKFKEHNSALNYLSSITGHSSNDWKGYPYAMPNPIDTYDNSLSATDLQKVDALAKIRLVSNSEVTRGILPEKDTDLVSANPLCVIFPGYSKYGPNSNYFANTDSAKSFLTGDLSKTMININWLERMFNDLGSSTSDHQKSADQTFSKFFKNIFNVVLDNSGTRFKLTLVTNPKDEFQVFIADINYIDGHIVPYELTAVNANSICRAMSLQSKIPPEFATAAFVSAANTMTSQRGDLSIITGSGAVKKDKNGIDTDKIRKDLDTTKSMLDGQGPTPSNVASLQSALRSVYQFITGVSAKQVQLGQAPKESIPFPLNFSATLDGIEGFIFGNVVTTNYLPAVYQTTKLAFTITKVEHVISNNDWTTILSTVCRLMPDNK